MSRTDAEAERDRARDLAAALEAQLAAVEVIAAQLVARADWLDDHGDTATCGYMRHTAAELRAALNNPEQP